MITNYSLDTTVEEVLNYTDAKQISDRVQHINCHIDDSASLELYFIQLEESMIVYCPEAECFIAKMSRDHKCLETIESAHLLAVDQLLDALEARAYTLDLIVMSDSFIGSCF